ncbi:translation initiation factor IF-2-like [Acinonyx jubatus]|uniref:Translation initiation factor IF-2-like n=1 Tax=Acinonyx jubatus TaxID=32536 RepID=A0ABM3P634_ACIJB|nr:translation initiation factor IF-2-like [Acinonyx jubatus]
MAEPSLKTRGNATSVDGWMKMGGRTRRVALTRSPCSRPRLGSGSSRRPWSRPLGPRASSCLGSPRAALGTEFPVASKGAQSQRRSQGARTAGTPAWPPPLSTRPAVRRQKREAALVSAVGGCDQGSAEPGASGNRAGISSFRQLGRSAPETTCRTKSPGLCLEGERIRGEEDGVPLGSLPRAWEPLQASPEPTGSPRDGSGASRCGNHNRQAAGAARVLSGGSPARGAGPHGPGLSPSDAPG